MRYPLFTIDCQHLGFKLLLPHFHYFTLSKHYGHHNILLIKKRLHCHIKIYLQTNNRFTGNLHNEQVT